MQMQNENGKRYGKSTKTDTIMKSENNKNWQHRKNIIGDTGCQEAEMRKEKWHKRKWQSVLFASAFSWSLITFLIAFFNYHQKALLSRKSG